MPLMSISEQLAKRRRKGKTETKLLVIRIDWDLAPFPCCCVSLKNLQITRQREKRARTKKNLKVKESPRMTKLHAFALSAGFSFLQHVERRLPYGGSWRGNFQYPADEIYSSRRTTTACASLRIPARKKSPYELPFEAPLPPIHPCNPLTSFSLFFSAESRRPASRKESRPSGSANRILFYVDTRVFAYRRKYYMAVLIGFQRHAGIRVCLFQRATVKRVYPEFVARTSLASQATTLFGEVGFLVSSLANI